MTNFAPALKTFTKIITDPITGKTTSYSWQDVYLNENGELVEVEGVEAVATDINEVLQMGLEDDLTNITTGVDWQGYLSKTTTLEEIYAQIKYTIDNFKVPNYNVICLNVTFENQMFVITTSINQQSIEIKVPINGNNT